ncbi:MFS transporter, partial [Streptomyces sp. SID89]|nr:MFS transporter [Streptomyces sp. SID89]
DARPARRERPDVLGAVLATGGAGLLVLGVVRTDTEGWGSPATWVALGVAAVLLAAFAVAESRSPAPLLRLGLLRGRWVAGANVLVFFSTAGQFAAFYFVSLYMQQVLGMGAAATGAAFLPFSVSLIAGSVVATRVTAARTPRTALVPGALLAAAGLAWFALISPDGGFLTDVLGPCVVTGAGVGLVIAPIVTAATTGVAPHEAGMASGLMNSSRQLGGCIGLAALATVAAHRTGSATGPAALNDGYALGLAVAAALFLVAALVAVAVLPRRPAGAPEPHPADPADPADPAGAGAETRAETGAGTGAATRLEGTPS